ncbi:MAG: FAD/NAD(P)-binding protein [Coriobacteriia bacterium]|nr:FAD/NAD(P)-binding protein [Coriobacteriia bacterium]
MKKTHVAVDSSQAYRELKQNPYRPWPARITSITKLTDTETLFEFRLIDHRVRERFNFNAGQFMELSVFGVGEAPISISSAPSKKGFIELCVRNAGAVTGALHKMRCGDIVGLRGPFGRGFPFEEMKGHDILMVAGGLGIAPLKSLINHIHDERHEFGKVTILLGARNPDEILFRQQFDMWRHRDDFDLIMTVDQPDETWDGEVGLVTRLFDQITVDPLKTIGVICGPPVMYRYAIDEMRKKKLSVDRIYMSFERRMKCGIGMCNHCGIGHQYACIDGPVFNYWEAMNLQEAM